MCRAEIKVWLTLTYGWMETLGMEMRSEKEEDQH
jgi:hypothetical protein